LRLGKDNGDYRLELEPEPAPAMKVGRSIRWSRFWFEF